MPPPLNHTLDRKKTKTRQERGSFLRPENRTGNRRAMHSCDVAILSPKADSRRHLSPRTETISRYDESLEQSRDLGRNESFSEPEEALVSRTKQFWRRLLQLPCSNDGSCSTGMLRHNNEIPGSSQGQHASLPGREPDIVPR